MFDWVLNTLLVSSSRKLKFSVHQELILNKIYKFYTEHIERTKLGDIKNFMESDKL